MPPINTTPFWERQESNIPNGILQLDAMGKIPLSMFPTGFTLPIDVDKLDGLHASDIIAVGQAALTSETAARQVADNTLTVDLASEVIRATGVENGIISDVTTLVTGLTNEGTIRQSTDNQLLNAITTEQGRAIAAENTLQTSLLLKADLIHGHVIADTSDLQTALDAKLAVDLRGVANGVASLGVDGLVPANQLPLTGGAVSSVNGKTGAVTIYSSDISGLDAAIAAKIPLTQRGVVNGVATLGADGKVPASQLPAVAQQSVYLTNVGFTSLADTLGIIISYPGGYIPSCVCGFTAISPIYTTIATYQLRSATTTNPAYLPYLGGYIFYIYKISGTGGSVSYQKNSLFIHNSYGGASMLTVTALLTGLTVGGYYQVQPYIEFAGGNNQSVMINRPSIMAVPVK